MAAKPETAKELRVKADKRRKRKRDKEQAQLFDAKSTNDDTASV